MWIQQSTESKETYFFTIKPKLFPKSLKYSAKASENRRLLEIPSCFETLSASVNNSFAREIAVFMEQ